MRNYRNVAAALVLALALSMPAFAGVLYTDKASPTPTPMAAGIMHTDAIADESIIHTDRAELAPEAADVVIQIALNLLQSTLTLF